MSKKEYTLKDFEKTLRQKKLERFHGKVSLEVNYYDGGITTANIDIKETHKPDQNTFFGNVKGRNIT